MMTGLTINCQFLVVFLFTIDATTHKQKFLSIQKVFSNKQKMIEFIKEQLNFQRGP